MKEQYSIMQRIGNGKEDVIDFKSIEDQWVLMEKNMILKQIINKIEMNKRNRL